jgi:hypothetical protein
LKQSYPSVNPQGPVINAIDAPSPSSPAVGQHTSQHRTLGSGVFIGGSVKTIDNHFALAGVEQAGSANVDAFWSQEGAWNDASAILIRDH